MKFSPEICLHVHRAPDTLIPVCWLPRGSWTSQQEPWPLPLDKAPRWPKGANLKPSERKQECNNSCFSLALTSPSVKGGASSSHPASAHWAWLGAKAPLFSHVLISQVQIWEIRRKRGSLLWWHWCSHETINRWVSVYQEENSTCLVVGADLEVEVEPQWEGQGSTAWRDLWARLSPNGAKKPPWEIWGKTGTDRMSVRSLMQEKAWCAWGAERRPVWLEHCEQAELCWGEVREASRGQSRPATQVQGGVRLPSQAWSEPWEDVYQQQNEVIDFYFKRRRDFLRFSSVDFTEGNRFVPSHCGRPHGQNVSETKPNTVLQGHAISHRCAAGRKGESAKLSAWQTPNWAAAWLPCEIRQLPLLFLKGYLLKHL